MSSRTSSLVSTAIGRPSASTMGRCRTSSVDEEAEGVGDGIVDSEAAGFGGHDGFDGGVAIDAGGVGAGDEVALGDDADEAVIVNDGDAADWFHRGGCECWSEWVCRARYG